MNDHQKRVACTETLQVYEALPSNEKALIPSWLVESLKRYYDPEIAKKREPEKILRNMGDYTADVMQILVYFGYVCSAKELNECVNRRNRKFMIDLMSYKMGSDPIDTKND